MDFTGVDFISVWILIGVEVIVIVGKMYLLLPVGLSVEWLVVERPRRWALGVM
jgi:hypothetical protein